MNVRDNYGMYHDKAVKSDGTASSDNAWIYTAFAKLHNLPIPSDQELWAYYRLCDNGGDYFSVDRKPNFKYIPTSHDEILGMNYLGVLDYKKLKDSHFNYNNIRTEPPKPLYKIKWFKAIKQFWNLRGKHRLTVWRESGYEEALNLAFRLTPDRIYYIKKTNGDTPNLFETVMFYVQSFITFYRQDSNGSHNMRYLMLKHLGMENSWLFKYGARNNKFKYSFINYFPEDHPIREKVIKEGL